MRLNASKLLRFEYGFLLPAIGWGIGISTLSLSRGVSLPQVLWSPDKIAHLGSYAIWAIAWAWGSYRARLRWALGYIALGCTLWGLFLEGVQGTLPWRTFEWGNAVANALGAVLGVSVYYYFFHYKTT